MQQIECFVVFYLEDVRVTSHKQLWRIGIEHGAHGVVIVTWVATDMLDEHIDILALESVQFAIHQAQVAAVAVATDSTERAESLKLLSHLYATDVASMPYLVTGLKVVQVLLIPIAVCVADNTNCLHGNDGINGSLQVKAFANKVGYQFLRLHQA